MAKRWSLKPEDGGSNPSLRVKRRWRCSSKAEQLFRKEQVAGSRPAIASKKRQKDKWGPIVQSVRILAFQAKDEGFKSPWGLQKIKVDFFRSVEVVKVFSNLGL